MEGATEKGIVFVFERTVFVLGRQLPVWKCPFLDPTTKPMYIRFLMDVLVQMDLLLLDMLAVLKDSTGDI